MKKAFSLVEILVALIMVSLITAAIAPVITKKLSSAGITIAGGGSGGGAGSAYKNDCADIVAHCALCTSDKCVVCKNTYDLQDDGTCKKEDALDVNSLVNHPYTTSGCSANCALCSASACVVCNDAYDLKADGTCSAEAAVTHPISTSCSSIDSNCTSCTSSACLTCKDGYIVKAGKCAALYRDVTKEDCNILNTVYIPKSVTGTKNICVLKSNPGDMGVPIATKSECKTVSSQCSETSIWPYSCARTVCQFASMDINCNSLNISGYKGWRLATIKEAAKFKTNYSDGKGSDGLMLCGHGVDISKSERCGVDSSSTAYPHYVVVINDDLLTDHQIYRLDNNSWFVSNIGEDSSFYFSYRCVLDKVLIDI